jgi:transcriptional regulator with XRE-family HTH domain
MTLGQKIRDARKAKGLTLEDLALQCDRKKSWLSAVETDALKGGPDPETIVRISEALNDTSILTLALQENPIFLAILPRIFPDLNNIRRDPAIIFTRLAREAEEAKDAADNLAELFSNSDPERVPGYEQTFKAKMEQLVHIKRGVEIAEFELIAARIVTEEWIKEVYELQQRKCKECVHHKPDTVYKTLYGTRGKAEQGESLNVKEGLRQDGYWPEDKEQGEAANG